MRARFCRLIGATILCLGLAGCAPKKPVGSHPAAPRRIERLFRLECLDKIVPDPAKWHCVVTDSLDGITCDPGSYVFKPKPSSTESACIEIHVIQGEQ